MRTSNQRRAVLVVLAIFIAGQPPFVRAFHIHPEPPAGAAHKLEACAEGEQGEGDHHDECPFCPAGQCACSVSAVALVVPSPPLMLPTVCLQHQIVDVAVVYVPHVPALPTPPPRG